MSQADAHRTGLPVVIALSIIAVLVSGGVMYALATARAPSHAEATLARQDAYRSARQQTERSSYTAARADARKTGAREGARSGRRAGRRAGAARGAAKRRSIERRRAEEAAAAQAAQQAAQGPPLVTLPNGEPGYALPEDQRTLSCVGIDASSGDCIGD